MEPEAEVFIAGEPRTVGVNGKEFTFERIQPGKAQRRINDRLVRALWVSPLHAETGVIHNATVNEFDDGVLYGPSSVPGVFSDFAGAAAAEVTVRWLELANEHLIAKVKRQKDIMMATTGILCILGIVFLSFR